MRSKIISQAIDQSINRRTRAKIQFFEDSYPFFQGRSFGEKPLGSYEEIIKVGTFGFKSASFLAAGAGVIGNPLHDR